MLFYFTILKHHFINIPYHFTIPPHSKTLFLLKCYFLTHSLLFLHNRSALFSRAFQQPFLFLFPSSGSTHNTHPLYNDQPIQTHHHTHTHKHKHQTSNKAKHKHNPATKPHTNTTQQQSQGTHTNTNPFKNWATDQKPRPGHRSMPSINQSMPPI